MRTDAEVKKIEGILLGKKNSQVEPITRFLSKTSFRNKPKFAKVYDEEEYLNEVGE